MKCDKPMLARGLNQKAACHPPSDRFALWRRRTAHRRPLAAGSTWSANNDSRITSCVICGTPRVFLFFAGSLPARHPAPRRRTPAMCPLRNPGLDLPPILCTRHLAPCYLLLQQVFCCRARLARQTPHRPHRHAWSRQPVRLLALALRPMMRGLKAPLRMPDAADAVPKPRNRIGRFSHRFPPIRAQRPWLPPPLAALPDRPIQLKRPV